MGMGDKVGGKPGGCLSPDCMPPAAGFMRQLAAYESDLRRRSAMGNAHAPDAEEL